jgi:hypothetical protein
LLPPSKSSVLFAGPAAYNKEFPEKRGVILTFDVDEPESIIRESLDNLVLHPDLDELPIIVFRCDYEIGSARIIAHGKGRDYEAENWFLSRIEQPTKLDTNTLVLICSDSRVHPPITPNGLPMAIQTLGGYIPKYTGSDDETKQLNSFFDNWLTHETSSPHILVIAHGNFEGEGPSCGAGKACLHADEIENEILKSVIKELADAAAPFETQPAENAEDRVKSLTSAIRQNLLSYPSISQSEFSDFIDILLMDTVSNVLSTIDL